MVISWKMPRVTNWKIQCRTKIGVLHLGFVVGGPRLIGILFYVVELTSGGFRVTKMREVVN
jgi:hypothetical protein